MEEKDYQVKVGDIFRASWGYDMIIVDFFQVVKVTAKSVTVREIEGKVVEGQGGYSGQVIPAPGKFKKQWNGYDGQYQELPPITRKLKGSGQEQYIMADDVRFARLWNGKPQFFDHMD